MSKRSEKIWEQQNHQWRDPAQVVGLFEPDAADEARLLQCKTIGPWWKLLSEAGIRLIVSREYEHLLLMLGAEKNSPEISYLRLPHPSGIAVDQKNHFVYVASTRNPNQVFTFQPIAGMFFRKEKKNFSLSRVNDKPLIPVRTNFYPGSLYIHDLSVMGEKLYATATGHNMVVELLPKGGYLPRWWPRCVDHKGAPRNEANYLQLNSIAAGKGIRNSFFSASASAISCNSPRDPDFQVDHRGVIFSAKNGAPICGGLTRPHSARQYQGKIWVDNSGYGEIGYIDGDRFKVVAQLPGWTRGLCFHGGIAFVGTSRILPRFERFAPGLNIKECFCGVHAVELKSGNILASLRWPQGNQVFAIESLSKSFASGLPKTFCPAGGKDDCKNLFYAYK